MANPNPDQSGIEPYRWRPGQSGNPGGRPIAWRRRLELVFGDGEELYQAMFELAVGRSVHQPRIDPNTGQQAVDPKSGAKLWNEIRPNAYAMVAAFQALRDTLIGKPVSVDVTTWTGGQEQGDSQAAQLLDGLEPEDIAALQAIAKRAATVIRQATGAELRATIPDGVIDTTAEPISLEEEARRRALEPEPVGGEALE